MAIWLRDVTIAKGSRNLFEDLNFEVQEGEHWVVQGANGSGKTLMLHLLAGMLTPLRGVVSHSFIDGTDWDSLYQQRQQRIHFIPTHWMHAFVPGLDGLFYQQRYYSMDESQLPKVRDVFGEELSGLHKFQVSANFDVQSLLDLDITRLSNGQLKKVIILRQLVRSLPNVLILDYPFDGLDGDSKRDLSQFLDTLANKLGIQIILTDHGQNLPRVINRKLTLHNFKIAKIESTGPRLSADIHLPGKETTKQWTTENLPVVEMQGVTIEYNGRKIISNLNWRINKGERWALTGKNGSGKTTLFSLIYADHPMAYSQKVFLFGKRRGSGESIWDIKKRINYFGPEQIHFLNTKAINITAREYILKQRPNSASKLNDLVKFFGAYGYINLPVKHLSAGELQMALLLNMFLDEKELLLLDEPFQFLDPDNHAKVTSYLSHYLDKDITLVLITHDENDVAQWTHMRKTL